MSKRLIFVLALVFVATMVAGAYAEVQNVKVSGDMLMRAINRSNFTLSKAPDTKYNVSGFTTTTRLRVDADLTDNVATTVRLLNERSWGMENNWMGAVALDTDKNSAVDIDLAYVTLKEFLNMAPLTLTIGRQEIKFGNGLVIGDPDTILWADETGIPMDLSSRKAFDAIRATLNYDPLVIDLIMAKVNETDAQWFATNQRENNDVTLWGINALYNLGMNNATVEAYYFKRTDKDIDTWSVPDAFQAKEDTTNVVGFLAQGEVLPKQLKASVEYAYQFGNASSYLGNALANPILLIGPFNAKRSAWATQAQLTYMYQEQPCLGFIYTYLSGDKNIADGKMKGWDPMYTSQIGNNVVSALLPASDVSIFNVWGGIKPAEDITISAVYGYYRLNKEMQDLMNGVVAPDYVRILGVTPYGQNFGGYSMTGKTSLGSAIDINALYDYTEDVQFGLTFGMMFLGDAFRKDVGAVSGGVFGMVTNHQNPRQLIGSMKVTF